MRTGTVAHDDLRKQGMSAGKLPARLLSASVLGALAFTAAYLGGWAANVLAAAAAAVVLLEWIGLTEGEGAHQAAGYAVAVALAACLTGLAPGWAAAVLAAVVAVAAARRSPWRSIGVIYSFVLAFSLLGLRGADLGFEAVVFLFAVVIGTDTGGYCAGTIIGGPRLWPAVSPKKTWAGAAGGLALAVLMGMVALAALAIPLSAPLTLVAIFLSVSAQCGDLFESAIKRRFGVKDSGSIIPGHGGLMDRVDGLIFAAAVAGVIGLLHGGPGDPARGLVVW